MWPPCPPQPQQYQPLPISTGAVGIDRCGNIEVYAAPRTVHRQVCWPACGWPIPPSFVGWYNSGGGDMGGGWGAGLANLLTSGAAMANWMIANRTKPNP